MKWNVIGLSETKKEGQTIEENENYIVFNSGNRSEKTVLDLWSKNI